MSKGKNGHEVAEQSLLRQIRLEMMEPKVCFVCIEVDFAISSTDFYEVNISVYDSSVLEQKNHSNVFCFSSAEICFPDWVRFFLLQY